MPASRSTRRSTYPRWRAVQGSLGVEGLAGELADGLAALGHAVERRPDGHPLFGAAAVAGLDCADGHGRVRGRPPARGLGAVR